MNYYYMDGLDKKGPYTKEEIKLRMLSAETLVIKEGMAQWNKLESFKELNEQKFKEENDNNSINSKSIDEDTNSEKIKVSSNIFLYLGVIVSILISIGIAYIQKKQDLKSFNLKINEIMSGKTAISDYSFDGTTDGKLLKVYRSGLFDGIFTSGDKDNVVKTQNHNLAFKPNDNIKEGDNSYYWNEQQRKYWDLYKDLKEYYESDKFSGFTAKKLERNGDVFTVNYMWSGDMAYKVPASKHYNGFSNEYYSDPGYDIPTYRPSIAKCYEGAAKYLTVEDKDKSYQEGSYKKIDKFEYMESDFYEIEQLYPKYYKGLDTIYAQNRPGDNRTYVLDDQKITKETSRTDAYVYTSQWIVWYKYYTNTYSIVEKKYNLLKISSIYSLIGILLTILTFYILKNRKRFEFK